MKKVDIKIGATKNKGYGIFAVRDFVRGELVVRGKRIRVLNNRTKYSFQYGEKVHLMLDKLTRTMNHSCNPNVGVRNNHLGAYDFIAFRKIRKGEEITWDYETIEYEISAFSKCLCESNGCREIIRGVSLPSLLLG